MKTRIGLCMLAVLASATPAAAQSPSRPNGPPAGRQAGPPPAATAQQQQPLAPGAPVLQRRQPAPQAASAPFQLSPYEQAQVDRVLAAWEQHSSGFRKFECEFTRFEYDAVFGERKTPRFIDVGFIKYAAPDKGVFRVTHTKQGENVVPVDPRRAEHWLCDGKSIFGYDFAQKRLVEHKLPPELQGKAIANGPLPFLFGAQAERLKQRYFVRIVTPRDAKGEVWLEAYPRFQADAANFQRAEIILKTEGMVPFALQLHLPTGQQRTVYQFADIKVNQRDPGDLLDLFPDNDFRAALPSGWKKIVEDAPPTREASRPTGRQGG